MVGIESYDQLQLQRWADDGGGGYHELDRENQGDAAGDESAETRSVYPVLADHQLREDWQFREIARQAQEWAKKLVREFKLDVGPISLCIDRISRNTLGHFRPKHNGFGLLGEIAINSDHLRAHITSPSVEFELHWDAIGTLFHELLHAHQVKAGTASQGNHHNQEFQEMAANFGLLVDRYGITTYDPDGRFIALLKQNSIKVPENLEALQKVATHRAKPKGTGKSKLKKWSCAGCVKAVNARVARADFAALCLNCRRRFKCQDSTLAPAADVQIMGELERTMYLDWVAAVFVMLASRRGPDANNKSAVVKLFGEITGLGAEHVNELVEQGFRRPDSQL